MRDDERDLLTLLDESGSTLHRCEVVDGQRRLTTCGVLLDRVRPRLVELAGSVADGASAMAENLRRTYGLVTINQASLPRLRLGSDLNSYWVDVVLGEEAYAGGLCSAGRSR